MEFMNREFNGSILGLTAEEFAQLLNAIGICGDLEPLSPHATEATEKLAEALDRLGSFEKLSAVLYFLYGEPKEGETLDLDKVRQVIWDLPGWSLNGDILDYFDLGKAVYLRSGRTAPAEYVEDGRVYFYDLGWDWYHGPDGHGYFTPFGFLS